MLRRMPRIAPESVQAVRDAADLVELVRARVALTRRGGRWVGRCPFHEERTPSFGLLPDGHRYYCFGCGATGDAIDWMREQEGAASFADAVVALAERFGVPLSYASESAAERAARANRERRDELLERAARFYEHYLWQSAEAAPARQYLRERAIPDELVRRYRIGFSPGDGDRLSESALARGFTRAHLIDAGLSRAHGARVGDFFRGRIMFPIADARGRVQGFGARTLDPNERAKYVNSPEGPQFHKRHLLYGLDHARPAAAKQGWLVVAEGYTDVLALVASGVDAAVACMGTSLTPEQLRLVTRWVGEVRVCFDADGAGQRAARRTVEAARGIPVSLSAVGLPVGKDPGDLIGSEEGRHQLASAVAHAEPLLTSLIRLRAAEAGHAPRERERALDDIVALLRTVSDGSLEKDEGVRVASGLLQLSQGAEARLRQDISRVDARGRRDADRAPAGPRLPGAAGAQEIRERRLLAMALALGAQADPYLTDLPAQALVVPEHRRALDLLRAGERDPQRWPDDLRPLASALEVEAALGRATTDELREAIYRLQLPVLRRRATELREAGDERGSLDALELARRVEAALRGAE